MAVLQSSIVRIDRPRFDRLPRVSSAAARAMPVSTTGTSSSRMAPRPFTSTNVSPLL